MFLHYSDLPSHTALLYLSENALKSFVPARSAFLYRLLSLPSFVEIYGDVYDPISVVFLTAAIVFRLHLFSNDRAVHPTLQIMLHYYLFFFQYIPSIPNNSVSYYQIIAKLPYNSFCLTFLIKIYENFKKSVHFICFLTQYRNTLQSPSAFLQMPEYSLLK